MNKNPPVRNTPEPEILPPERKATASISPNFRIAFALAVLADAIQIAIFPLFIEGAMEPATDAIDLVMAAVLYFLIGWHWEFLPSFAGKLIPGVDLVPLWTLAVANVYRKSKRDLAPTEPIR